MSLIQKESIKYHLVDLKVRKLKDLLLPWQPTYYLIFGFPFLDKFSNIPENFTLLKSVHSFSSYGCLNMTLQHIQLCYLVCGETSVPVYIFL